MAYYRVPVSGHHLSHLFIHQKNPASTAKGNGIHSTMMSVNKPSRIGLSPTHCSAAWLCVGSDRGTSPIHYDIIIDAPQIQSFVRSHLPFSVAIFTIYIFYPHSTSDAAECYSRYRQQANTTKLNSQTP